MTADTMGRRTSRLDPIKEAEAVARLKQSLGALADDEELLTNTIEGETSLMEAVEKIMTGIDDDQILVNGIKARESELKARRQRIEERIETRKAVIEQALTVAELRTLQCPGYTLTLADRAPKVEIADEAAIPSDYFKTEVKLDKAAVGKALKAGEVVPGASLSNAAPSLTIRRA